ncbi:hypothetical protein ASC65_14590 [Brevundimonas sp. Root1279]|nr:hypothetical protein ASC65_14590 [Brevundimonas sp. Root1279]
MRTSSVLVAPLPCLFDEQRDVCDLTKLTSVAGVLEPQWRDQSGFTVIGNTRRGWPGWVFSFEFGDADDTEWTPGAAAEFGAAPYDLIRTGYNPKSVPEQAAEYDRVIGLVDAKAALPIGGYWAGDQFLGYLYELRGSLNLRYAPPSGPAADLGIASPLLPDARLGLNRSNEIELLAQGFRAPLDNAPEAVRVAFDRDVFDAGSGRIIGSFGVRSTTLPPSWEKAATSLQQALTELGDPHLVAVATVEAQGQIFAMAERVDGSRFLLKVGRDGQRAIRPITCSTDKTTGASVTVKREDWGQDAWPMPVTMYATEGADTLIVFLHGGPGKNHAATAPPHQAVQYLDRGYSVAIVEYSGSSGAGLDLASRIATFGGEALANDAALVSAAARQRRSQYRFIGLHAESFGGSLLTQPELSGFDFLIALAPYVRIHAPETWTVNRLEPVQLEYQRGFERAFFGAQESPARASFETALERQLSSWRLSIPALIVLGDRDDYSRPSDFYALARDPQTEVFVVDGRNHLTVFSAHETQSAVQRFLDRTISTSSGQ